MPFRQRLLHTPHRASATTSDTSDAAGILDYNEVYCVLICRKCKYAIQKRAVGSHLLRHKLYRKNRQRLLSSIARLQLLEPDDVRLPPAGTPPIDGLPIIPGYTCTASGCETHYASNKRLRRHWSESHGVKDPSASCARSVSLQTFFRGTKLRYFEVAKAGIPVVHGDGGKRTAQQLSSNVMPTTAPQVKSPKLAPTSEAPAFGQPTSMGRAAFSVQSFMASVQGCADQILALQLAACSDDMTGETFTLASNFCKRSSAADVPNNAPPALLALLKRLRTLPYRMAEALEKPDSIDDFTATLAAIDALVECGSLSYVSDDAQAAWLGMESWLRKISDHFKHLVSCKVPAALIVLAHWTVFVKQAEAHCWFLRGSAARVFEQIASDLPQGSKVQSLIDGILV